MIIPPAEWRLLAARLCQASAQGRVRLPESPAGTACRHENAAAQGDGTAKDDLGMLFAREWNFVTRATDPEEPSTAGRFRACNCSEIARTSLVDRRVCREPAANWMRMTKSAWNRSMARLRRGAAAGNIAAIRDLGLTLIDGIQDRQGRCLVRRNSPYAVRLLPHAAKNGDSGAATMLAHAYDVGKGIRRNRLLAIKWYRHAVRQGEPLAAANLATVYRDQGRLRLAHQWHLRAVKMGDGDAAVDAGYDYLYGIGVRKNPRSAKRMLRTAVRNGLITQNSREEALYHLAVAEADGGRAYRAVPLLEKANRDNDYPEAASLLAQIGTNAKLTPCRCRRHLHRHLPGHAKCPQHPADGRLPRAN